MSSAVLVGSSDSPTTAAQKAAALPAMPALQTALSSTGHKTDPNLRQVAHIADKIRERVAEQRTFFSFEYFPPKTPSGVENLYDRIDRMSRVEPLFCDMTWGAGGSTSELTLDLSGNIQKYLGLDCMMHLTCTNMPAGKVREGLDGAKTRGIRNILALRGDPPAGQEWVQCEDGFAHAVDLVRFIRAEYGDYFCICVAGYPEGHPAGSLSGAITYEQEMDYLEEKVKAGADLIITQMFYDVDVFLKFVLDCRKRGMELPILPGILPIQNYAGFKRMTGFCKTQVPPSVDAALEPIRDDDAAVKEYGIKMATDMCRRILDSGLSPGIHFYSLNLEKSVMAVVDQLGLVPQTQSIRSLPWRPATLDKRRTEDVRPIFWANRPKSYLERTSAWDDFPNGRWGDNRSPAFGDISNHHLVGSGGLTNADARAASRELYGPIGSEQDVVDVFVRFFKGSLKRLPWVEASELANETVAISAPLLWLNRNGLMTINSQPRVNAAPSTDMSVGWGGPGGFVYQKAYVEFFASPEMTDALFKAAERFPSLTVYAAKADSKELRTNSKTPGANAVTWGVFPEREIIQPTIVDPYSFRVWKAEAFNLWLSHWADLYEAEDASKGVLRNIHDTYSLINVVDNDFVAGDIWRIFSDVIPSTCGATKASVRTA